MLSHGCRFSEYFRRVSFGHHFCQAEQTSAVHTAKHGIDLSVMNLTLTKCDRLISQRQGITHAALRRAPKRPKCGFIVRNRFGVQNFAEIPHNTLRGHVLQAELQASGKNGDRKLLRVCCRQQKLNVFWGFFECFQKCVKAVR